MRFPPLGWRHFEAVLRANRIEGLWSSFENFSKATKSMRKNPTRLVRALTTFFISRKRFWDLWGVGVGSMWGLWNHLYETWNAYEILVKSSRWRFLRGANCCAWHYWDYHPWMTTFHCYFQYCPALTVTATTAMTAIVTTTTTIHCYLCVQKECQASFLLWASHTIIFEGILEYNIRLHWRCILISFCIEACRSAEVNSKLDAPILPPD